MSFRTPRSWDGVRADLTQINLISYSHGGGNENEREEETRKGDRNERGSEREFWEIEILGTRGRARRGAERHARNSPRGCC